MRLAGIDFPSYDQARMIKLYGISTSRAGRCVWALEEIGLDYEHVPIHFNDGSTRTPKYLAINPNARIPTLIDGELVLYESMAINHYLADRYDGGLKPHTPDGAARALMWSFWTNNEIENLLRPLLRNRLFLEDADRDPKQGDVAAAELAKPLHILDDALAGQDYLLGDRISVADLNASHGMFWIPLAGIDLAAHPNLEGWLRRLADRPALQKAWGSERPEMEIADRRPLGEVDPRRGF
jgi:glutathione S-transferase